MSGPEPGQADLSHGGRADAIVVAAGASSRMGSLDKLAVPIGGRPLLAWTLAALAAAPEVERIVLVTAAARAEALRTAPWLSPAVAAVVAGGSRRQESVAAGFAALESLDGLVGPEHAGRADGDVGAVRAGADARVVLVHDGARPCVSPGLIGAVVRAAIAYGAAVPVLPIAETIKEIVDGRVVRTVDRDRLAAAQTPQGVRRELLRRALAERPPGGDETWTDEAALLEACRIPVHALPGEPWNIKVTLPADLERAERALLGASASQRVGLGYDSHPFGPARPLALGGIVIDDAPRLHGHSDGDVALHAVADALLGAAGLGDLGRLFPADARTPRGIASRELLGTVVARLADAGLRPTGVDLTIVGVRPRLGPRLDAMRDAIAGILDLATTSVNVKASTGNLEGSEGAGRGMAAHAVATVGPR